MVVIKNAGHAFNVEKAKEFYSILKSFLVDSQSPAESSRRKSNDIHPVWIQTPGKQMLIKTFQCKGGSSMACWMNKL